MSRRRRAPSLALAVIALLLALPGGAGAQQRPDVDAPEVRALWVDAFHDGFKTPQQVDRMLDDARRANFNTLFVQVRRRGDAYQANRMEPRTEDASLAPNFDPLQYIIDRARAQEPRLEVHAWIATLPIWSKADVPPRDSEHAFNRHGPGTDGGDYWLTRRDDGETWAEEYNLDPGNPDAASYIVDVATWLVRNYDIDGLHLDRLRYPEGAPPERRWGYNMASVARFNDRYGRSGQPEPNDPLWGDWRREQITSLVRRIYLESLALKPQLKVSAAVVPWGRGPLNEADWLRSSPYSSVFQDWRQWLRDGIIDLAVPMNYNREEQEQQRQWFDSWINWQRDLPHNRQIVAGLGAYLNTPESTLDQIQRARAASPSGRRLAGLALYSYAVSNRSLTNTDPADDLPTSAMMMAFSVVDEPGRMTTFPRPAQVPDMPWKSAGERGHLAVSLGRALDGARISFNGAEARTATADGNGCAGFVDVPVGQYELSIEHGSLEGPRRLKVDVAGGRVTRADLS